MEAVINHVPAFAISLAHRGKEVAFDHAARFGRRLAQVILQKGLPAGVLLNVNVPLEWNGGVRLTRQSGKVTRTVLQEGADPRGRIYYWLERGAGERSPRPTERLCRRPGGPGVRDANPIGTHPRAFPR